MFTVSTINVNGIRAAAKKGFPAWLETTKADVVALQEVRAEEHQVPEAVTRVEGWNWVWVPSQVAKGRAGVALATRAVPQAVRFGFGSAEFDTHGRYVEVDLPEVTVGSLYLPSGETGTARQDEKMRFLEEFGAYMREKLDQSRRSGRHFLVCGDYNIAHTEADLKNWRGNKKTSGFLPEERQWLSDLYATGLVDVVRSLHPDQEGPYSWWSYRGKAFDNDAGWRIDVHVATPDLAASARQATVERDASYDSRMSDHAPVTVTYDIG
ncbi:exodeoxyribonuclease III [Natronoglycomyces albus]|uniref:Exodeoxyribonuclease III n=1 Tax=Natronoglycomyces albus TaxID=2811108 RepID=A0A895XYY6_9ACTN|nr:exodeoxyribonuclease III [Natronoglycomyces albus]QSB06818.1 exodeoxyribonuclease III [Natronoglycomyces albus]